jgi:protein-S-isoprenylcysteine O-methyltransferase Ste14
MTAEAEMANQPDREQARESINTMRIIGGLLVIVGLLLYFFHLAEAPMGHSTLGVLAAVFAVAGVALLWVGWRRIRALR